MSETPAYKVSVSNKGGQRPSISVKAAKAAAKTEQLTLSKKTDAAKIAESGVFAQMQPEALAALAQAVNAAMHNIPSAEAA